MALKVFKFGGASVSSPERIENIASILQSHHSDNLVVVISAMGKTTNELEHVATAFFNQKANEAKQLFATIKQKHIDIIKGLMPQPSKLCIDRFDNLCQEVEMLLQGDVQREYDYYYDQIVSIGELLSTSIISSYLSEIKNLKNVWVDIRDVLKTDNNFRDVNILWNESQQSASTILKPILQNEKLVIIQGFIGSTLENETTTLGREGSDYTAAIFANLLHAESQTIWKDVKGVMNADPKKFPEAVFISELDYNEVIEMAYYGAQVIHPKTMKPLYNKSIPLHVRCFLDPTLPGTTIHKKTNTALPPIIMQKNEQVLLQLTSKDLSFVSEKPIKEFLDILSSLKIKTNLTQSEAVSIYAVLDSTSKVEKMIELAKNTFHIMRHNNKQLLTIRHYNDDIIQQLIKNRNKHLEQKTAQTYQVVLDA